MATDRSGNCSWQESTIMPGHGSFRFSAQGGLSSGNTDVPEEDGFKVIPAVSNVWNLKLYAGIVTTVVLLATSFPRCFVAVVVVSFICFFWGWGEGGRGEGLYCH